MSYLMIYLIFNVEKIESVLLAIGVLLIIGDFAFLISIFANGGGFDSCWNGNEYAISENGKKQKNILITIIVISLVIFTLLAFIPSRETLIAMQVKELATLENYNWTVEQLKGLVDYIVEAINKIGR